MTATGLRVGGCCSKCGSAGAKLVFAPRHKSKFSRHNWEGQGKNEELKINKSRLQSFLFYSSLIAATSIASCILIVPLNTKFLVVSVGLCSGSGGKHLYEGNL